MCSEPPLPLPLPSLFSDAASFFSKETLRELFSDADVISVNCLLSDETRHIVGHESLKWVKKGAFLVNTARGE